MPHYYCTKSHICHVTICRVAASIAIKPASSDKGVIILEQTFLVPRRVGYQIHGRKLKKKMKRPASKGDIRCNAFIRNS